MVAQEDAQKGQDPTQDNIPSPSASSSSSAGTGTSSVKTTTSAGTPLGQSITQGELLRQEQLAGSVPVPLGHSSSPHISTIDPNTTGLTGTEAVIAEGRGGDSTVGVPAGEGEGVLEGEEEIEKPHVRGPTEVGVEDMGPQKESASGGGGFDVEGAVGRKGEGEGMGAVVDVEGGEGKEEENEGEKDRDGDLVIVDADGEMREE